MNKKTIITALFALIAMMGQAQVTCHIEGELRDTTQGKTVVICPANVDIRVSDNYVTAKADAQGHFSCDVDTDKMRLYNVFLHEQWERGSWRNENFLVENADGKLIDDNYYNGRPFCYGLSRLPRESRQLELRILPLQENIPVYLPREADKTPGEEVTSITIE